jgi:hypothetical protein
MPCQTGPALYNQRGKQQAFVASCQAMGTLTTDLKVVMLDHPAASVASGCPIGAQLMIAHITLIAASDSAGQHTCQP